MNKIIFVLCFIVSLSFVNALTCDYTDIGTNEVEKIHFFEGDKDLGLGVVIYDKTGDSFRLISHFDFAVNVSVTWQSSSRGSRGIGTELNPNEIYEFYIAQEDIQYNTLVIRLTSHPSIGPRTVMEEIDTIVCKECPKNTGIYCLNDGQLCNLSSQCGGGYCIENRCNRVPKCFNNECECNTGEFQCLDNSRCAKLATVPSGQIPICNDKRECISGYIKNKICVQQTGQSCQINSECAEGYCINYKCSSSKTCYNNECNCKPNEIQRSDNTGCVKKDAINIGSYPLANLIEECVSQKYTSPIFTNFTIIRKFIDPETGKCAVHPDISEQKQKDEAQLKKIGDRNFFLIVAIMFFLILITLVFGFVILIKKLNERDNQIKEMELKLLAKKEDTLKIEIQKLNFEIEKIGKKIEHAKTYDDRIVELQKKVKNLSEKESKTKQEVAKLTELQKKLESEITKSEKHKSKLHEDISSAKLDYSQLSEKINFLKAKKHKTEEEENEILEKENLLEKQKASIEKNTQDLAKRQELFIKSNYDFFKNLAVDKYRQRYHQKIYFDEKTGYIRFTSNNEFLHRYIYKNKISNDIEYSEVHHIDNDSLNNELYNLIALPVAVHHRFNHGKVDFRDWSSGINELIKQLNITKEELFNMNPYIKQHNGEN